MEKLLEEVEKKKLHSLRPAERTVVRITAPYVTTAWRAALQEAISRSSFLRRARR